MTFCGQLLLLHSVYRQATRQRDLNIALEPHPTMRLDGRTALITGGTQGVGAAIAKSLANAGCNLVLHGLREDKTSEETARLCIGAGVQVHSVFSDLAGPTDECVQQLICLVDELGVDVDILVNNAGTCVDTAFLEMDYSKFELTMRLNVFAGYFLTQTFAKRWVERSVAGRVLFTGSINGVLSEPDHTAYDTSKGAVHAMVRSLCVSLAPHNIRVNTMAPGLFVTPLTEHALTGDPPFMEWMKLHTPNKQVPTPEACGAAALFLLSDEAEHIHGQTLLVDGGMSVWQQPDLPDDFRAK